MVVQWWGRPEEARGQAVQGRGVAGVPVRRALSPTTGPLGPGGSFLEAALTRIADPQPSRVPRACSPLRGGPRGKGLTV